MDNSAKGYFVQERYERNDSIVHGGGGFEEERFIQSWQNSSKMQRPSQRGYSQKRHGWSCLAKSVNEVVGPDTATKRLMGFRDLRSTAFT